MSSLPSQHDLNIRASTAQTKLDALKTAYDNFVKQWEQIEKEESVLVKQAHQYLDADKMRTILSKIHSSND